MPGETVDLFLRMPDLSIVLRRHFRPLQHFEPLQIGCASLQVPVRIIIYRTQHCLDQTAEDLAWRKCR